MSNSLVMQRKKKVFFIYDDVMMEPRKRKRNQYDNLHIGIRQMVNISTYFFSSGILSISATIGLTYCRFNSCF